MKIEKNSTGQPCEIGRVGVLAGGPSSEREISLRSGHAVHKALVEEGCDALFLDLCGDARSIIKSSLIDVAFIALHGRFGEDGTVQSILEEEQIPYTGSGALASAHAFDKVAAKKRFTECGVATPRYVVAERGRGIIGDIDPLGWPLVVKPALEGSSIGLSIVQHRDELTAAIETAFRYGDTVLLEEYILGRELTVGILDEEALPVVEIVTKDRVYDYKAKYQDPVTKYLVPAPMERAEYALVQKAGIDAHRALGCRSFSRVDMIFRAPGEVFVLEVNTIPGMTNRSLLPKAAQAHGISFNKLCLKLVRDAKKIP